MRSGIRRAIVVAWVCWAGSAWSAPSEASQAAYVDGQARFTAGDYVGAAAKFETAYQLDPDPAYLFNIAQAYRLGHQCAKAVELYRRFLDKVPDPPDVETVRRFLAESETCAAERQLREPAHPVITRTTIDHGRTKRAVGIVSIAVGVGGLGAGVLFMRRAARFEAHRAELCAAGCDWPAVRSRADSDDRKGKTAEIGMTVSYAAGAAAIIGGVLLYAIGRSAVEVVVMPIGTEGAVVTGTLAF